MGRADREFPIPALIGAPADKTTAAVGRDVGIQRPQRGGGREVIQAAAVLPVVVDVPGNRQSRALFGTKAVGMVGVGSVVGFVTGGTGGVGTTAAITWVLASFVLTYLAPALVVYTTSVVYVPGGVEVGITPV